MKDETKPGQYAKLPPTLLKLFGQDKINEYDEIFKVSKGFLRKGVHWKYQINNSENILIPSLMTSIIELIYSDEDNGIRGYNECVEVIENSKDVESKRKDYEFYLRDKIKKQEEPDENDEKEKRNYEGHKETTKFNNKIHK